MPGRATPDPQNGQTGQTEPTGQTRTSGTLRALTRPHMLVLHLAAVVALVATILLGRWQLGAWQEHREDRTAEIASSAPVALTSLIGPDDPFPAEDAGRPVEATGTWLTGQSLYVADRPHDGEIGYWLVTPFAVCPDDACVDGSALPVVVGWTATTDDIPPSDLAPTGSADITAWLQSGEQDDIRDADPSDLVLPSLRIAELVRLVDRDLYSAFAILRDPPAIDALDPVTPESLPRPPASTALRNLLYAVQWWIFSGFGVFLWWRWCRDEIESTRSSRSASARIASQV